jgi:hypothetical protein
MLALFIKIVLSFLAIRYSITLLKEINSLRRYPYLLASCFIGLAIILIVHHNFFRLYPGSAVTNFQLLKLIGCILLMRIPVGFLHWLLIGTLHLTISNTEDAIKLSRAGWYPIRAANRTTVTNGIATLKATKENVILALMFLLLCGNWMAHHPVLCLSILSAFYLYKNSLRILNFLKIC